MESISLVNFIVCCLFWTTISMIGFNIALNVIFSDAVEAEEIEKIKEVA